MDRSLLTKELERDEGLRTKPYVDTVGKTTIGVGRNLTDRGISSDEAYYLLDSDITLVIADLNRSLPWWSTLTDPRQRVLANMCFNMGIGGLLTFTNTLSLIKSGAYEAAATEMLKSKWATQVGARADRLAEMMRIG